MENPSKDSVEQLWGFVSHLDVEIDEEGYIIGWKKVSTREGKLVDSHTYRVPNDLGNIVEMPRWMVDNNRNVTCLRVFTLVLGIMFVASQVIQF